MIVSHREIINTWDQCVAAGGDRIVIGYHSPGPREVSSNAYYVWRVRDGHEVATDKDAAWYDNKRKHFIVMHPLREHKPAALAAAIAWVTRTYGPRQFVRNRMGDHVEAEVNAQFPIFRPLVRRAGTRGGGLSGRK